MESPFDFELEEPVYLRVKYNPRVGMDHRYVCNLPTWSMVGYDPVTETMVVKVPDDDLPKELLDDKQTTASSTHIGKVVTGADEAAVKAWHAHLDQRYAGQHGKFRPQLA